MSKSRASAGQFLKELPVLIVLALGIALLLKAFVVQAFYIEQQSMEPTLHPGDRVLVNRFDYRFGKPDRGDVVILRDPRITCEGPNPSPGCARGFVSKMLDWVAGVFGLPTGSKQDLVKRIVALPGETFAMHDGIVYVCKSPCQPLTKSDKPKDGRKITFPHTRDRGPQRDHDDVEPIRVTANHYFVLGDNRANSSDSRAFGAIPRRNIVGRAFVLIWPPSRFRGL